MTTYYFVAASEAFMLITEPLLEVLGERTRNYQRRNKPIDFWLIKHPQFLEDSRLQELTKDCPRPAVAVVSTDELFMTWLKNRLAYVINGSFESADLPR